MVDPAVSPGSAGARFRLAVDRSHVHADVLVEYPVGHPRRRPEGIPLLFAKAERNLARRLPANAAAAVLDLFRDADRLDRLPVSRFVDLLVPAT